MGIDVRWQDEGGEVLARLAHVPLDWRVTRALPPEESHCLQYIDPVGDAVFNQLQLPRLVRELERAAAALSNSRLRENAEAVLAFVRGCEGVHTYVAFIGD